MTTAAGGTGASRPQTTAARAVCWATCGRSVGVNATPAALKSMTVGDYARRITNCIACRNPLNLSPPHLRPTPAHPPAPQGGVQAERRQLHFHRKLLFERLRAMLLPAADYNVYRGGSRLSSGGDCARPPIGASPGELRLWMKLHGELDRGKVAEETRLHARNGGRGARRSLEATSLLTVASDGVVKSGRRAGQKAAPLVEATNQQSTFSAGKGKAACVDCVRLRQQGSERAATLKASENRVGGLEAKLKSMALELEAAQDEGERQSSVVAELEAKMVAAAKAEKERTTAMAQRMAQLMQTVAAQQEELRAERDGNAAPSPPAGAASAEAEVEPGEFGDEEAAGESYSEDEDQ